MYQPLVSRLQDAPAYAPDRAAVPDKAWDEHGWALSGSGLAMVILVILIASAVTQLIG